MYLAEFAVFYVKDSYDKRNIASLKKKQQLKDN